MSGAVASPMLAGLGPVARLGLLGGLALALTAAGMPVLFGLGDIAFLALATGSAAVAFLAARPATIGLPADVVPTGDERAVLLIVLGVGLALRLIALPAPPILSTDLFRYVWDGRVQAAGINPYRFVPADPALIGLRDGLIYPFINRADYAVTIYPPVAQAFFLAVTRLSESPLAMKAALTACEGVTVLALLGLLRRLGLPSVRLAAYAWHPLPIWEIAGTGHVDALMVALMTLGIWLVLARGRFVLGAAVVALGALAKPFALLALPPLWRPALPWPARIGMVLAVPATMMLAYLPYLSVGWGALGFLGQGYAHEEGLANGWGFTLLRLWRAMFGEWPHDTQVYVGLSLAILAGLSLRFGFRRARTPARALLDINAMCMAFLVLASPEFPWYALLIVPFLSVAETGAGWVMSVGVFAIYAVRQGYGLVSFETRADWLAVLVIGAGIAGAARSRRTVSAARS